MTRPLPIVLLCAAILLGVAPGSAAAATAGRSSLDGESLVYSADPGEANRLTVSRDGDRVAFDDAGATVTPGYGCTAVTPHRVSCERPSGGSTSVELGDGNDEATTSGDVGDAAGTIYLSGEQGDDTLHGTADSNGLSGGAGDNTLDVGPGTTSVDAVLTLGDGSPFGMPEIVPGRDTINCVPPATSAGFRSVVIDESDVVNGDCGVVPSVFTPTAVVVRGTDGPDVLAGNYYPTRLYGLGGDDRIFSTGTTRNRADGGPGNDTIESGGLLLGGDGNDRLTSAIANDLPVRQDGGPGDDLLVGRYGNDRLAGGPGRDRMSGGSGNDYLNARDGEVDTVHCGDGRADRVVADRADKVARDCERVSRR